MPRDVFVMRAPQPEPKWEWGRWLRGERRAFALRKYPGARIVSDDGRRIAVMYPPRVDHITMTVGLAPPVN